MGLGQRPRPHPDLLAAIVPISGGGDPKNAKSSAGIAVWAFHGEKDEAVPVAKCERMFAAIRKLGGQPRLTILPGAGHQICEPVCARAIFGSGLFRQRHDR